MIEVKSVFATLLIAYIIMIIGYMYGNLNFGDLNILVTWIEKTPSKAFSPSKKTTRAPKLLQPNYAT